MAGVKGTRRGPGFPCRAPDPTPPLSPRPRRDASEIMAGIPSPPSVLAGVRVIVRIILWRPDVLSARWPVFHRFSALDSCFPHRTFRSAFRLITARYPSENSTSALFIPAFLPGGGAIIRHFSPFRFIAPGMFPRGPQEYRYSVTVCIPSPPNGQGPPPAGVGCQRSYPAHPLALHYSPGEDQQHGSGGHHFTPDSSS